MGGQPISILLYVRILSLSGCFKVVCDFVAGWMGWNLHCCRRRLLSYYLPFVSSLSPYPHSVFWVHVVFSLVSLS